MAAKTATAKPTTDADLAEDEVIVSDQPIDVRNDLKVVKPRSEAAGVMHATVDKAVAEAIDSPDNLSNVRAAKVGISDEDAAKYRNQLGASVQRHKGWGVTFKKDTRIQSATAGRFLWQVRPVMERKPKGELETADA